MRRAGIVLTLVLAALQPACDRGAPNGDDGPAKLRVFAAASLTEAFAEVEAAFEAANKEIDVELTFAGSSTLARQITDGADADVFVSADAETAARVTDDPDELVTVARNELAIAVAPGNPKGIRDLRDLARERDGVVLAVCSPDVPCGRYAQRAFDRAGIAPKAATLEGDVKAVVAKVALGEADAGVVYRSDARAARDRVDEVAIGVDGDDLVARYVAVVLVPPGGPRATASAFVDFLQREQGQRLLERFGFLPA